jgi:hypothetical protein
MGRKQAAPIRAKDKPLATQRCENLQRCLDIPNVSDASLQEARREALRRLMTQKDPSTAATKRHRHVHDVVNKCALMHEAEHAARVSLNIERLERDARAKDACADEAANSELTQLDIEEKRDRAFTEPPIVLCLTLSGERKQLSVSCSKVLLTDPLELHNFAMGFLTLANTARDQSRKKYVATGRLTGRPEAAAFGLHLAGPSAAIYRSAKVALLEALVSVQNEMLASKTREVKDAKEPDLLAALDAFSALLASTVGCRGVHTVLSCAVLLKTGSHSYACNKS